MKVWSWMRLMMVRTPSARASEQATRLVSSRLVIARKWSHDPTLARRSTSAQLPLPWTTRKLSSSSIAAARRGSASITVTSCPASLMTRLRWVPTSPAPTITTFMVGGSVAARRRR